MSEKSWVQKISSAITGSLERFFYFWGYSIAVRPVHFICVCFLLTGLSCLGLLNFYREIRPEKLFVPFGSSFYNTTLWFMENFPPPVRQEFVILKGDDVLQPGAMQQMLRIHQVVSNFNISNGKNWQDVCFKLPVVTSLGANTEFLKGFRNRILAKRDVADHTFSSYRSIDPLPMFSEDFFEFDEGFHEDKSGTKKKKQRQNNQNSSDIYSATSDKENSIFKNSNFDHFDSEFTSDTFKHSLTNVTDFSVVMPSDLYCALVDSVPKACWEFSLLELWKYDENVINKLTKEDIIRDLNTIKKSPVFGSPSDYRPLLGGRTLDEEGRIISATALMSMWHVKVNYSNIQDDNNLLDSGMSNPADPDTLEWEAHFIDKILYKKEYGDYELFLRSWRSLSDVSIESMGDGIVYLILGYTAMFLYILLMFSESNVIDTKLLSAIMGIMAVFMGLIFCIGICSGFSLMFGPMHLNIGILLLGLGVDDMFMIAQCWDMLSDSDKAKAIPEKMGLTMKHAGVSITITSLTNFIAFMVGATTIFPYFSSFCIYLATGILVVYIFQATFFVGWFVLEQRRIASRRNPVIICYKHKERKPRFKSAKHIFQLGFNKFSQLLPNLYFKGIVIGLCILFVAISVRSALQLEVLYKLEWIMPMNSYLVRFAEVFQSEYTTHGDEGVFILSGINYTSEMHVIEEFVNKAKAETDVMDFHEEWYTDFKEFVNINFNENIPNTTLPEDRFLSYLGRFLFSPSGAQHQKSFRFDAPLECGKPAPSFMVSIMPFHMRGFNGASEHVPAMKKLRKLTTDCNFNDPNAWITAWAYIFMLWEIDANVFEDTVRNLALASAAIFVCVLLFLANITTGLLVIACVFITLVEVIGFMQICNLQLNILTVTAVTISVGLSVDFAVHIGHAFLAVPGNKAERASKAFRDIGPAVFNGGFSTLLAYSFLSQTNVLGILMLLKVITLVILFALFNGLVFLPVVLSFVGPDPYQAISLPTEEHNNGLYHKGRSKENEGRRKNGTNGHHIHIPEAETMLHGKAIVT